MCGICGFLSSDPQRPPEAGGLGAVRRMADALSHRGPDAEGILSDGPLTLGHRRLSIIDLSPEATQPLANEDGSVIAVVNGEIYNFAALRADLVACGHRFRSHSDSEVIVHLYEEYGPACVEHLRGMFAFAVWDQRAQRLFLARDRTGKKPLYYTVRPEGFWFASELRALWAALPERPSPDLAAIDRYLTLHYVPAPLTAFAGIHKLPAAHQLTVTPGGTPDVRRYWRLDFTADPQVSEADAIAEARSLLEESVRLRAVADVPVGAFLSGGIDSATVVALLARQSSRPVKTFSIDFPSVDRGEAPFAQLVAERYRTEHHVLRVTPDMTTILPEVVRRYGEPFADSSAIPVYYLSQLARQHVIVALSGDGGDEAFAGYYRYALELLSRALGRLPGRSLTLLQRVLESIPGSRLLPVRQFAAHLDRPVAERYLFLFHFMPSDKAALIGPALREHLARDAVAEDFANRLAASSAKDPTNQLLDLDIQTYLADDILTKVDIASMAHALEVRAPLLDHVLLERMARVPGAFKLRHWQGKHILRRAVSDLVPREILQRRKKGFGLPLGRWMREDLADMSRDLLTDAKTRSRGLLNPRTVERLLDEHRAGANHGVRLWNLLVLELWYREFVDNQAA